MEKNTGLSFAKVKVEQEKHGLNILPSRNENRTVKILIDQLKSPLIYILFFAGTVSLVLKEINDSIIIFATIFINTIFGFYQEYKAERSLQALNKIIPERAKVIREGKAWEIESWELVAGDIVIVKAGEKIAADGIILEETGLSANESILTGESMPVVKNKNDTILKGTVALTGHGKYRVTRIGEKTKIGWIAHTLKTSVDDKTPLQKRLEKLTKILGILFLTISFLLFIAGIIAGRPVFIMLETAVAVAVASIPEGAVISLTVILTIAMRKILAKKALVRKLVSAETLGATTVICTDKTGTLTEGLMRVTREKIFQENTALLGAVLCNHLHDAEEISLWQWSKTKKGFDPQKEKEQRKILYEIPFSSERKYMLTIHKNLNKEKGKYDIFVKGAPEIVLNYCRQGKKYKKYIDLYAKEGLRVMAIAHKIINDFGRQKSIEAYGEFEIAGIFGFEDPLRVDVKKAVFLCQKAGIRVKIITGDYKETALAVARKLGLEVKENEILDQEELKHLKGVDLDRRVLESVIFSRVMPEEKFIIVQSLKNQGEVVAVTGDGVNDALALKKADIGIVLSEGTEVAKETADMVLLDSNFSTIINAVYEGRVIFENIKKSLIYLLTDSFTEIVLIVGSLFLALPLPILPVQILWVNLFNDTLPNLALAYEREDEGVLNVPPRKSTEPILDGEAKTIIFIVGVITDIFLFLIFLYLLKLDYDIDFIRSFILAALGIDSLLYIFSCKTFRKNLWQINLLDNKRLLASVFLSFVLLYSAFYLPFLMKILKVSPLALWEWGVLLFLGFAELGLIEFVKYLYLRRNTKSL